MKNNDILSGFLYEVKKMSVKSVYLMISVINFRFINFDINFVANLDSLKQSKLINKVVNIHLKPQHNYDLWKSLNDFNL